MKNFLSRDKSKGILPVVPPKAEPARKLASSSATTETTSTSLVRDVVVRSQYGQSPSRRAAEFTDSALSVAVSAPRILQSSAVQRAVCEIQQMALDFVKAMGQHKDRHRLREPAYRYLDRLNLFDHRYIFRNLIAGPLIAIEQRGTTDDFFPAVRSIVGALAASDGVIREGLSKNSPHAAILAKAEYFDSTDVFLRTGAPEYRQFRTPLEPEEDLLHMFETSPLRSRKSMGSLVQYFGQASEQMAAIFRQLSHHGHHEVMSYETAFSMEQLVKTLDASYRRLTCGYSAKSEGTEWLPKRPSENIEEKQVRAQNEAAMHKFREQEAEHNRILKIENDKKINEELLLARQRAVAAAAQAELEKEEQSKQDKENAEKKALRDGQSRRQTVADERQEAFRSSAERLRNGSVDLLPPWGNGFSQASAISFVRQERNFTSWSNSKVGGPGSPAFTSPNEPHPSKFGLPTPTRPMAKEIAFRPQGDGAEDDASSTKEDKPPLSSTSSAPDAATSAEESSARKDRGNTAKEFDHVKAESDRVKREHDLILQQRREELQQKRFEQHMIQMQRQMAIEAQKLRYESALHAARQII